MTSTSQPVMLILEYNASEWLSWVESRLHGSRLEPNAIQPVAFIQDTDKNLKNPGVEHLFAELSWEF